MNECNQNILEESASFHRFFWLQAGKPALILAPMEGVINCPMRELLTRSRAFSLCVSEFLRVGPTGIPDDVFLKRVPELQYGGKTAFGTSCQIQLLGDTAEPMAAAAFKAYQLGACAIDLNFGCPSKTVVKHGGGAFLLKHPQKLRTIMESVRKSVPKECAVSAKMRLGWENPDDIHENADRISEGGASWITIHARTKTGGYSAPVHWKSIAKVQKRLSIPIVANGDIFGIEDFLRCQDETRCEHFMLGRGAVSDPLLTHKIHQLLYGFLPEPCGHVTELESENLNSPDDWVPWFMEYAKLAMRHGDSLACITKRIKQWARMASERGKVDWFERIKRAPTLDAILQILKN